MTTANDRRVTLRRGVTVISVIAGSMWLLPLYFDGIRSMLLRITNTALSSANRDVFSLAAASVMIPIAYAWRRSRVTGASVQIGILIVVVAWLARFDPSVLRAWWSYAGVLFVICAGMAGLVSAVLFVLAKFGSGKEAK